MIEHYSFLPDYEKTRPDSFLLPLQDVMREADKTHALPVFTGMTVDSLCSPARIAAFNTSFGRIALVTGSRRVYREETKASEAELNDIYFSQISIRPQPRNLKHEEIVRIPTLMLTTAQALTYPESNTIAYQAMDAKTRAKIFVEMMDAKTGEKVVLPDTAHTIADKVYFAELIKFLCTNDVGIAELKFNLSEILANYRAVQASYYDLGFTQFVGQVLPVMPQHMIEPEGPNKLAKSA